MYEENPSFLRELNGKFHGFLADKTRGTSILFNDRYGMHRLYYHQSRDVFYFAAEAKAILAVCPHLRTVDPQGLGEFVACDCVLENRTIFKAIHVLPQASAWTFRNGSIARKNTYFQPKEWEDQAGLGSERYYEKLRHVISQNFSRYFNGNQRIGVALTGGLDTRVIMAWSNALGSAQPCYTFGGMLRDSRDVRVARRIATACEQAHEVIRVGSPFLEKFPQYAERSVFLTDGCLDAYRGTDLYLSERARSIAPVKVVGTYGSELLHGSVMFKPVTPSAGLFRPEFLSYVDQAKDTYWQVRSAHPVTFAAFRQFPWYHCGILSVEQTQLTVRSPYLDNDIVQTAYLAPRSTTHNDVRLRLVQDRNPALAQIRSDRGIGGSSRGPFSTASRSLHEFSFKAEYAYDSGMPQWLAGLDHLFAPFHFERLFLGRHKFAHFRLWYRDALAGYVRDILLDPRSLKRPYLDARRVEAIVCRHFKGDRNYTNEIHKLLTLEIIHRLFFDPQRNRNHSGKHVLDGSLLRPR
jgi:asparagine synthase (glutamine-hydrolysing)